MWAQADTVVATAAPVPCGRKTMLSSKEEVQVLYSTSFSSRGNNHPSFTKIRQISYGAEMRIQDYWSLSHTSEKKDLLEEIFYILQCNLSLKQERGTAGKVKMNVDHEVKLLVEEINRLGTRETEHCRVVYATRTALPPTEMDLGTTKTGLYRSKKWNQILDFQEFKMMMGN
uniref:Costars family protein ABRACL isoform X4 n=1 Tax=Geotrypetes seraphini TaxID=260995 RepID=A0A6P8Q794_GEOSA|nr:costars family protein ABRACL isoform X4 [Geotrypetes seraphini]